MRTLTFLSLFFMLAQMSAQPYQITFSGSGLSNTVTTVEVLNLTQGTTLTLNGSDILELVTNIGVPEVVSNNGEIIIYPNPAENSCRLEFYNRQNGDVRIELFDASGKLILQNEDYLTQGSHSYELSGLKSGMFVLNVHTPASSCSVKVISTGFVSGLPLLRYGGINSPTAHQARVASPSGTIQMQYNAGEMLLFKGISGNHSRIITLLPTQNWSINFEFIASADTDGNHYPVVTIGTQTWMAGNLQTTKYSNGDPIPNVTDSADWKNLTMGAYCWYNNDEATYGSTYGALYNWYAVNNTKNLCPTGWHVPTVAEWETFTDFLGGDSIAGGPLKETGTAHWNSPNTGATNSSGFTALPGGGRNSSNGNFYNIGYGGYWWSSTAYSTTTAWLWLLNYSYSNVNRGSSNKNSGFSVRCLRD